VTQSKQPSLASPGIRTQYGPASTPDNASTSQADEAYQAWQGNQTPENLNHTVNALGPTIEHALNAYTSQPSNIVRHKARLMAADAVKAYDPNRGANLATHVYRQLQSLQRVGPSTDQHMRIAEGLRRHRAVIGKAIQQVQDDLGREASDEEVAEIAKLPVKRVTKVRQMLHAGVPLSVVEEMGDEDSESPDIIAHNQTGEQDWHDAVYHDLGDVDRVIMQYRTGFRGYPVLSTQEIAKRLRISPAAVSQRAVRIQGRLDEYHG